MHLTDHLTEVQLNEYLDDQLKDRAQVELHLSVCKDCAARLTALQALFTEIESLPEMTPSSDIAAAVTRRVGGSSAAFPGMPRWLTLTVGLQAAAALIAGILAAPFVIDFVSSSLPLMPAPSFNDMFFQVQSQWIAWLDTLSQLQMPAMPELPLVFDMSGLYFMLTLAGSAMFWLVGNGILLRNQIK
jgi:anti-sigma factor RsiW